MKVGYSVVGSAKEYYIYLNDTNFRYNLGDKEIPNEFVVYEDSSLSEADIAKKEFKKKALYNREAKVIKWNWKSKGGECWVSKSKPKIASPSLRNCYEFTDSACCNYIED